jgi:PQQ-dependent dehydrogenase (s-GDH family)
MRILHLYAVFLLLGSFFTITGLYAQPSNNTCAGASLIATDSACVTGKSRLIGQTLTGATADGYAITSTCGVSSTYQDVWYKFIAKTKTPTITVSNVGTGWGGNNNVRIQLVSGNCSVNGFTQIACASGPTLTPSLTNSLTEGNTYFIRIHNNTTTVAANSTFDICITDVLQKASRMNEVFSRTVLSDPNVLNFPWEVTYGPDNNLWITESKGYKVYRMNPNNGTKTTVLDISQGSTFLPLADRTFNCQFNNGTGAQGGLAGLALHPNFLDGTGSENNSVYISYIHSSNGGSSPTGVFFTNRLVKFNYNKITGVLETPVSLCDTLPGSSDHNSQRIIIAPVTTGGTQYLFYASGDMGAGQFGNRLRPQKAQNPNSYEGKILRFNLVSDGDAGLNAWLPNAPNANPYGANSAVYSIGIRNNQGFAYDTELNKLYSSSHGPYSDDEINIIEPFKNYGHPLVIGFAADGNYNGNLSAGTSTSISAGANLADNSGNSSCPPIGNEATRKDAINTASADSYRDPIFSAYNPSSAVITNIWQNNTGNGTWPSEGWSGLDLYTTKLIPGWKKSLVASGLKWGRLIRLPLNATGDTTMPSKARGISTDTITYFQSTNRYRDLAFAPNGKDMFVIMDNNSATSGPGVANPTTPACPGCVIKYSFLGYEDANGLSTIPKSIAVTSGTLNACTNGTSVTIDGSNNYLWVPITGPDGNIMAEINAMGQNLGLVTSTFYKHLGLVRTANGKKYLDRNITISPANTFASPVKVRLYFTKAELDALIAAPSSGVASISNVQILKNNDACAAVLSSTTNAFSATNNAGADLQHGANGYVLQTSVSSFSSFYFAAANIVLPVDLITFTGALQSDLSALLNWKTQTEINIAGFDVERSTDGNVYSKIEYQKAAGNTSNATSYSLTDNEAVNQQALILYYRLKVIDKDGSYNYSSIITITLPVTKASITIAPNPVQNDLKASIISPITGNVTLRIFDNAGRLILQTASFVRKGCNSFIQNINNLSSGLYYVYISAKGIVARTKFLKL